MLYSNVYTTLPIMVRNESTKKKALFVVLDHNHPDLYCINETGKFNQNESKPLMIIEGDTVTASDPADVKAVNKALSAYSLSALVSSGFVTEQLAGTIALAYLRTEAHLHDLELPANADATTAYNCQKALDRSRSKISDVNFNKLVSAYVINSASDAVNSELESSES